jgi:hypothetical protein
MLVRRTKVHLSLEPQPRLSHRASPRLAFSIVDPAGTWAWRSGPVDAAAVRQGAVVLALLPAEVAVPLRAVAAVAELPLRAEPAVVELPLRAEAAAVAELPLRAEAAVVELLRAEAAYAP